MDRQTDRQTDRYISEIILFVSINGLFCECNVSGCVLQRTNQPAGGCWWLQRTSPPSRRVDFPINTTGIHLRVTMDILPYSSYLF